LSCGITVMSMASGGGMIWGKGAELAVFTDLEAAAGHGFHIRVDALVTPPKLRGGSGDGGGRWMYRRRGDFRA
jgi:hypothetical protein